MDEPGFDRDGFATAFAQFVAAMNAESVPRVSAVRRLAFDVLGVDPSELPVVGEDVAQYDQVNLQLAIQEWAHGGEREVEAFGLTAPGLRFMGLELGELISRRPSDRGIELGPVQYTEARLPDGERLLCYESALLSVRDGDERLLVLVARGQQRGPGPAALRVEVMARNAEVGAAWLSELRRLRHVANVYRGRVLAVEQGDERNPFSDDLSLRLIESASVRRDELVLPDGVLDRIERHTIEFARHTEQLLAAGRALRRGVLLYGPPGTGKTHTVRYLSSVMRGRTTFVISGAAFGVLTPICKLARDLAPSMVVLEDVDLVALERTLPGPGRNPLLFSLMNEMDGVGPDADVVFLLTTNRADLIEPALASRPGRIDLAVEIPLPDRDCRRKLIELYGTDVSITLGDLDGILDRTEGVSAAFIKELLRRAALVAATRASTDSERLDVRDEHVAVALDEMSNDSDLLTRSILGAAPSGGSPHDGPPAASSPPRW